MDRPTPEEIAEARKDALSAIENAEVGRGLDGYQIEAIRKLVAATEPPTLDEICAVYNVATRRPSCGSEETPVARVVRHFLGPVKP
jgi:hypothetical protein